MSLSCFDVACVFFWNSARRKPLPRTWRRTCERWWAPATGRRRRRTTVATPSRDRALRAWCEIGRALAASPDVSDRNLSDAIVLFIREAPAMRDILRERARQMELPGVARSHAPAATSVRADPGIERSLRSTGQVFATGGLGCWLLERQGRRKHPVRDQAIDGRAADAGCLDDRRQAREHSYRLGEPMVNEA